MKKSKYLVVALLWLLSSVAWGQDTIRIMTININQGADTTLEKIGTFIKSQNPDFVAVQEVDIYPNRAYAQHQRNKNFMAELGYYADMQGVFGKAMAHPAGGWDYGDAIFTKHSFTKSESVALKHLAKTEKRQLLMIHTEINGHSICFASTHLCHENAVNRVMQMRQIKNIMKKQKEKIQFVCGDLNSDLSEDLVFTILRDWKDALPPEEGTCSSDKAWHYKAHKYDYILYNFKKVKKDIEVIYSAIECDVNITDHCIGITDIVLH